MHFTRLNRHLVFRVTQLLLGVVIMVLYFTIPLHVELITRFSGIIVDATGQPVEKSIVRLQGKLNWTLTDSQGNFELLTGGAVTSKYITAWKSGFYIGGQRITNNKQDYRITLNPIFSNDDPHYEWLPSTMKQTRIEGNSSAEARPCQECHSHIVNEWLSSTHATSATNPLFLALYGRVDPSGKNGGNLAYRSDFPRSKGNCSTCHIPIQGAGNPFNSDPYDATVLEKEGASCDFCHKIDDARIDNSGGYPGTMSIKFKRPPHGRQLFFGPYNDVFPGDDSYLPLYKESRYCAPCHHGKFWGVLMYSEFQEWADSEYGRQNITCQDCHMNPDGVTTHVASEEVGGLKRDPRTIPTHGFTGVSDRTFMSEAIDLTAAASRVSDVLSVRITIRNTKAGHHYPTGNPMRNMVLLVDVHDDNRHRFPMILGSTVPVWGGVGPVREGNYAGLPGKGFAKVLRDMNLYGNSQQRDFQPEYPAPHWRPTFIESDNRIPAYGTDVSHYQFRVPADQTGRVTIDSRLIFRRSYKTWMDRKNLKFEDLEIAHKVLTLGGNGQ
jgi:hypothetical protein